MANMEQIQRIDKWLWIARIVKTRTLATRLVSGGTVRINGIRNIKPGKMVRTGDVVTLVRSGRVQVLKVADFAARRGPYVEAVLLYEDLSPPAKTGSAERVVAHAVREKGSGRPTKRNRRHMVAWTRP